MPDADERIERVEARLDGLTTEVRTVGHRMGRLEVLHEDLRSDVRLTAEVQTRHGEAIEEIREKVDTIQHDQRELRATMSEFVAFARQALDNHEQRLATLEKRRRVH